MPVEARALGHYEDLLEAKDVDAVYIPLPTGLRKDWVLRAAAAGKHVVCEKPCGNTLAEVQEMVEACRRQGVQFMDGVMFTHSGRLQRIRELLHEERAIGQIRRITSAFSFYAPEDFFTGNIRVHSQLEPHGSVGDLGWYCIRFALSVMNWQLPTLVSGRMLAQFGRTDSPEAVPSDFSGELMFEGGVSAGFYCSFVTGHQQWANVSGTEGYVHVPDFVLPYFGCELGIDVQKAVFNVRGCDFNMESHLRREVVREYSNSDATSQETLLFRRFADQVLSGELNDEWPQMALKTQLVMHGCLRSARENVPSVEL